jgi:hypothetical protein
MRNLLWCAVCAISLGATSVLAEDYSDDEDGEPPSGVGVEIQLGGGVQDFVDRDVAAVTSPAGAWGARLIVGTRSHIAGEAAYLGSSQGLNTLGVDDRAMLTSNGIEGALRYNVLTGAWQPYAVAGYTWRRYNVTNTAANFSSVADSGNVSEIPVGVGLAYRFKPLVADLRVSLHNAFNTTIIPNGNLTNYSGNLKLGFEF